MKSKATNAFSVVDSGTCPSHFQNSLSSFFAPTVLFQDPAHANNFIFPAMASNRRVAFLSLVHMRLQAHK
jgi:hypothetical protein